MAYGDNLEYARGRLVDSYIQHKGRVAYVRSVSSGALEEGEDDDGEPIILARGPVTAELIFEGRQTEVVPVDDLDLTPIPTGYAPAVDTWIYFARLPVRAWRQGLCNKNCMAMGNGDSDAVRVAPSIHQLGTIFNKKYVSKEEAFKKGGAFSRNFCVEGGNLYYKAKHVADISPKGDLVWKPRCSHLQRRMERTV